MPENPLTRRFGVLPFAAALALTALRNPAAAQEMVTLVDGTACEARVKIRGGDARLITAFGERTLQKAEIAERGAVDALAEQYAFQAAGVRSGHLSGHEALARWCHERGYLSGLREQLEKILRLEPDHVAARRWVVELADAYALVPNERSSRSREQRQAAKALFETMALRNLVNAALVAEKAGQLPKDVVFRYAIDAFKHPNPGARWMGARLLADHRDRPERIVPLFRRSLADPIACVRREAVRSLKVTEDPVFVKLFAKNLFNPKQAIRMNAVEALAEFGMPQGLAPMVAALAGGGPTRNHIMSINSLAYLKDFDVEIAQAAVIADPIVDVVQEGTILDVGVVGLSVERGHLGRHLAALAGGGVNFGTDVLAWQKWLESREQVPPKK